MFGRALVLRWRQLEDVGGGGGSWDGYGKKKADYVEEVVGVGV